MCMQNIMLAERMSVWAYRSNVTVIAVDANVSLRSIKMLVVEMCIYDGKILMQDWISISGYFIEIICWLFIYIRGRYQEIDIKALAIIIYEEISSWNLSMECLAIFIYYKIKNKPKYIFLYNYILHALLLMQKT